MATLGEQFVTAFGQLNAILSVNAALEDAPIIGDVLSDFSTAAFDGRVQAVANALAGLAPNARAWSRQRSKAATCG